ncbi:cytochrome P450 [Nocardia macrotermitis]
MDGASAAARREPAVVNDVTSTDFFLGRELLENPYPYFDALRAKCPVTKEDHHGVYMVTGYDEALEVLNDPEKFSSCTSVTGPFPGFPVPLEGDDVSALIEEHRDALPFSDQLPTLDPPVHTQHRGLLMRLITPKRLKENEEAMWAIADRLLDEYLVADSVDFIRDFAGPFTLYTIADLLGVPPDDQEDFLYTLQRDPHRSEGNAIGSTKGDAMQENPIEFLYEKFSAYIEDRRREPRGDVLSSMAEAPFADGSQPPVRDVVAVAANLFSAGQETTVRLLSSALRVIAEQPEVQRLLREDHSRIGNFLEEVLRTESPVKGDFRLSKVPVTVGGVDLPAGTTLMVVNGGANRDPRKFEDPSTFDPQRSNARQHISFGRGIHTCPGAPLARAESRVAIERLLDRTSDIRIDERVHGPAEARVYKYVPTFVLRGLTELHLEFDPVESEAK